jgi:Tol biopolymer transport system component
MSSCAASCASVRILTAITASAALAAAQTTARISVDSAGAQANSGSFEPAVSGNGRFVAFRSSASNLVAGDTNGVADIFVHDRSSGSIERVTVSSAGVQGNGTCTRAALSTDGRFVAFSSSASNLVAGDTNNFADVFVRDRQLGTTERASFAPGAPQTNHNTEAPGISFDGRYVVFQSFASNLVSFDTNNTSDVFVLDRQTGQLELVSRDTSGVPADQQSHSPAMTPDGRFVAFASAATNLVAGDTNAFSDVFVLDRQLGTTELASLSSGGAQGDNVSLGPSISADGRYVAFWSRAGFLVANDTNGVDDVFLRDRIAGTTVRLSVDSGGLQSNASSLGPVISGDGRSVAFWSDATNLVAGDTNLKRDVFLRDVQAGTTERVSIDSASAQSNGVSQLPAISGDGRVVAFESVATNLVAGDTNNASDVFARDRGLGGPTAYCTAGTTTHGCVPSIAGTGTPSASASSGFVISVSSVEGLKQGIVFYGIDNLGFTPLAWGPSTSFLCVKTPTQRTAPQNSGGTLNGCDGTFALDWNAFRAANPSALGAPFAPGQHVYAQGWFRDPPSPKSTMLSDGLEFVVQP